MERCREHWFHEELCNPNPKQGGSREAFEQRNSARDLYFRKRALPQKNGLNCTSPLQVNSNVKHGGVVGYCDHCSNRRGLGASGANSGCSGTKARPGSASVQSWARAGIQEADPRHRGFSREGGGAKPQPPAGRPTLWLSPQFFRLLTAKPIDTEKTSPHREVQGEGIQTAQTFSIYRRAVTLCRMSNMEKSNMGAIKRSCNIKYGCMPHTIR